MNSPIRPAMIGNPIKVQARIAAARGAFSVAEIIARMIEPTDWLWSTVSVVE